MLLACIASMAVCVQAKAVSDEDVPPGMSRRQYSLVQNFAPYASYGLTYVAGQDEVYYNGDLVASFVDMRTENSFNLGYNVGFYEEGSGLYLRAVRDTSGNLVGIEPMPQELIDQLFFDASEPVKAEEKAWTPPLPSAPILPALPDLEENSSSDMYYITFDATCILPSKTKATDCLSAEDIPSDVSKWIASCQSDGLNVRQTAAKNGKSDIWLFYKGTQRLGWKLAESSTALELSLYDYGKEPAVFGGTLIHVQASSAYETFTAAYEQEPLKINLT